MFPKPYHFIERRLFTCTGYGVSSENKTANGKVGRMLNDLASVSETVEYLDSSFINESRTSGKQKQM
jgi:hypothetical protein